MKAMILAGGIGKRMYPIEQTKCLMKFFGTELINHKIELLEEAGISDLIIVANPENKEVIKEAVNSDVKIAIQEKPKGMADAILSGAELVGDDSLLILNAEDMVESQGISELVQGEGDSRLLGYEVSSYFPGGYFKLDGERITGMIEKPGPGNEPSNYVSIGVYFHRKFGKLLEYIEKASSSKDDIYEVAMDMMMADGFDYRISKYSGIWYPLKYPWHIWGLSDYFFSMRDNSHIDPSANIHPSAVVQGKVFIGKNVRIFENAVVRGPCYIGDDSIIGNNSLIWGGNHLGKGCVVGYSTELKNVYASDNVWFHQNYIGDSVIMDNCSLGAKTVTANFRFDEKNIRVRVGNSMVDTGCNKLGVLMGRNCRTGILVGLMPGVRIGSNSFLGPQTMISGDVEPGSCIFLQQNHHKLPASFNVNTDRSELKNKIG